MSPTESWLFVAETFAFLFVFWKLLNLTAEQFDRWLRSLRAAREHCTCTRSAISPRCPKHWGALVQPTAEDVGKLREETDSSALPS